MFGVAPRDPETLATPAIERLAEDEALRGDLSDDGWMPLQSWGFARLQALATDAARAPQPDTTMDGLTETVRAALRDAVAAAQNGDATDLAAAIRPRLVPREQVATTQAALRALTLGPDADANARAIAAALGSSE